MVSSMGYEERFTKEAKIKVTLIMRTEDFKQLTRKQKRVLPLVFEGKTMPAMKMITALANSLPAMNMEGKPIDHEVQLRKVYMLRGEKAINDYIDVVKNALVKHVQSAQIVHETATTTETQVRK